MGEVAGEVWEPLEVVESVGLPVEAAPVAVGAVPEPVSVAGGDPESEPEDAAPPVLVGMGGVDVKVTPTEAQRPWAKVSAAWTSDCGQVVMMH